MSRVRQRLILFLGLLWVLEIAIQRKNQIRTRTEHDGLAADLHDVPVQHGLDVDVSNHESSR
jgi:hypothetical protein